MFFPSIRKRKSIEYQSTFFLVFQLHRFPVIDNDILTPNLEQMIRSEPFVNVDLLIGATADEALYFAEEHMFNYYLPNKDGSISGSKPSSRSSSSRKSPSSSASMSFDDSIFSKKKEYIKTYLQTNHPNYICFYNEIQARYMPDLDQQKNLTTIARQYTTLIR